jgi:hypothetical protein
MDGRTGKQADRKIERDIYIYRERERYREKRGRGRKRKTNRLHTCLLLLPPHIFLSIPKVVTIVLRLHHPKLPPQY